MSGNVAINRETGEILVISPQGEWAPAQRARNPQTGEDLFNDGAMWRPVPAAPAPRPPDEGMRQIGLGTRATAQGLAAIPGVLYDAAGGIINMGVDALNSLAPREQSLSGLVTGEQPRPSWQLPRVRTARENVGSVLDAAGAPEPATPAERIMGAGIEGAASIIPSMGAGVALQAARAPGAVQSVAQASAAARPMAAPASMGNLAAPTGPLTQMLLTPMSTQIAAGAGGGVAQQGAVESGAGPVGQLAANLGGGVTAAGGAELLRGGGRLASSLLEPLTEAGRQRIVAEAHLRSTPSPETLATRLQQGLADTGNRLPESVPTFGEAARDPALLRVESSVRSGALGPIAQSTMGDADFARNATRTQAIEAMGDGATPDVRGATIRRALQGAEEGMGARVDQLFNLARDRNTSRYSVQPVLQDARAATRMFDPAQGGGGVPAELQSVIDDIANLRAVDLSQAQNIRARLGEIAGRASMAGDNRLASAAGSISTSLENTIDDPRWMQAVEARRTMGGNLGRDDTGTNAVGGIMRNDRFGAPMASNEAVPRQALSSPDAVRQVVRSSLQGIDDARTARNPNVNPDVLLEQHRNMMSALRGQFVENMMKAAQTTAVFTNSGGNTQLGLNIKKFNDFVRDNNRIAQELFEPHQYQQLSRIASDFAEGSMAANTGATRNSQTAQNMSVANMLSRVSNGMINSDNPTARQFGSLGGLLKIAYATPEAAMRDMLTRSMTDPEFAQMILARATPEAMQRVVTRLELNGVQQLQRAATGAALRQTTRTAGALEQPPQEP